MLNRKQQRFVQEYLVDLNGGKAAERAGYSPNGSDVQAVRLLANAKIAEAVSKAQQKVLDKVGLKAEDVMEVIRRHVHRDIRKLYDEKGNLKPIHELTAEEATMIAGVETIVKNAQAGDGHTDTVLKVKLQDQAKYVEIAAKHFGLLIERIEHSGTVSLEDRIKQGRTRAGTRKG